MDNLKAEKVTQTLTVYQKPGVFCYGTDAVMLANYVKSDIASLKNKKMCDMCSGTGIIPLLLCDFENTLQTTGLEINTDACEISKMSAKTSGYDASFSVVCGDVKEYKSLFSPEQFDFVTCNPPYMTNDCGKMCDFDYKTIARHEILCNIDDIFKAANYLLRTGSNFYVVYRTDRLASLFLAAQNNGFHIKQLTFASSGELPAQSKLVLCKAKKGASEGLKVTTSKTDTLCGK